jgi:uncharacterized protein (TIGR02266 family)
MPDTRRTSPRVAAVIQVRYRRREDFVLEYARDISSGGVFITSEDPLPEGEPVECQFYLPELARPVTMPGKIVRTIRSRTRGLSGMGIAFEALDEFTRATLMGYLKEMTSDRECIVDRRGKAVRYDQVLEVEYNSVGEFLKDYSENLSKNGIFVRTDEPQPADTVVPMKITLPNGEHIEVTGRVVHAIDADLASQIGRSAGMGIEFLHYHGSSQTRLWNYIESLSNG